MMTVRRTASQILIVQSLLEVANRLHSLLSLKGCQAIAVIEAVWAFNGSPMFVPILINAVHN